MSRTLATLLVATWLLSGCKRGNAEVSATADASPSIHPIDAATESLLLALRQNDEAAIGELGTAELSAALDERARAEIQRTLEFVGSFESLELVEEIPIVGGSERRYQVRFESGQVGLTVSSSGTAIRGVEFEKNAWLKLADEAANAAAGDLRVAAFEFTGPEGEPIDAPTDAKAIHYTISIEGLASNLREHEISVRKTVVNQKGAEVYKEREEEQMRFAAAEVGSTGGRIAGMVAVPKKGKYELHITITDRIALVSIEHVVPFVIP